jgi:hypothetical protein
MAKFYVKPGGPRPDFRLVLAFLWGDDHNCDTEGNCSHPASHNWTELYAQSRERPGEVVEIHPEENEPLLLAVESPIELLAAALAYFLAAATNGEASNSPGGPFASSDSLIERLGDFKLQRALDRVRQSPFQRATVSDPYPNLHTSNRE